jgi:hypothetical protein
VCTLHSDAPSPFELLAARCYGIVRKLVERLARLPGGRPAEPIFDSSVRAERAQTRCRLGCAATLKLSSYSDGAEPGGIIVAHHQAARAGGMRRITRQGRVGLLDCAHRRFSTRRTPTRRSECACARRVTAGSPSSSGQWTARASRRRVYCVRTAVTSWCATAAHARFVRCVVDDGCPFFCSTKRTQPFVEAAQV